MRNIILIAGLIILSLLSLGCGHSGEKNSPGATHNAPARAALPADSLIIELDGCEGKSVFEITLDKHHIEYIESALGNFVHAIDSIEISHEYGWMYSVNDSLGTIASDKYITRNGDRIKWHYRKF